MKPFMKFTLERCLARATGNKSSERMCRNLVCLRSTEFLIFVGK